MVEPVTDHRRDHARRTIGRRGHDLTASRVFFVHGHRVGRHPIVDLVRGREVHAAFRHEAVVDPLRAAFHKQPTGKDTVTGQTAINTLVHHVPNAFHTTVQFVQATARKFVFAFHIRNRQPAFRRHIEHLFGGLEREGHRLAVVSVFSRSEFFSREDKAATNRIIGHFGDHVALGVEAAQDQTVGVTFKVRAVVKDHVVFGVKVQDGQAFGGHGAFGFDPFQLCIRFFSVICVG